MYPFRHVLTVPLGQTVKAHAQRVEQLGQPDLRQLGAASRGPLGEVSFVAFDVLAAQIGDRPDFWRVCGQPAGELAQRLTSTRTIVAGRSDSRICST
jgi:hypothetical protein